MNQYLQIIFLVLVIQSVTCEIIKSDVDCYHQKLNKTGVCVGLKFCGSALNQLKNYELPQLCRYEEGYPIVCCPAEARRLDDRTNIYSSVSERKCKEYGERYNLEPIHLEYHIIGGENASLSEFPHMASLGYGEYPNIQWLCGGILVSEKFILTAAHCVKNRALGIVQHAQLGDIKLYSFDSKKYTIKNRYIHPDYQFPKNYNDIALLELERYVDMSGYIRPACLLTNPDENAFRHKALTATGWGVLSQHGPRSEILQKVILEYFDNYECNELYKPNRRMELGVREDSQICYGSRRESKDSCQGDSGGPLQFYDYDAQSHRIVGVVSIGYGCGFPGTPGIYTRVTRYVSWIESIVWR